MSRKSSAMQSRQTVPWALTSDNHDILAKVEGDAAKLPFTLTRIGDVDAPAIIAAAVYAGHRYAEELDEIVDIDEPMKHDLPDVGAVLPALRPL